MNRLTFYKMSWNERLSKAEASVSKTYNTVD